MLLWRTQSKAELSPCAGTDMLATSLSRPLHAGLMNETNFNSTHIQEYKVPHFPFPVWQDESMHELLMQLARCVADVIKEARDPFQPPGNVLRSLIRADVVLTEQQGLVSSHTCMCLVRCIPYVRHVTCVVHNTMNSG